MLGVASALQDDVPVGKGSDHGLTPRRIVGVDDQLRQTTGQRCRHRLMQRPAVFGEILLHSAPVGGIGSPGNKASSDQPVDESRDARRFHGQPLGQAATGSAPCRQPVEQPKLRDRKLELAQRDLDLS